MMLWLGGVGTVASFTKLSTIFRKHPSSQIVPKQVTHTLSRWIYVPLLILALFCLVTGIFGSVLTEFLANFVFGEDTGITLPLYSLNNLIDTAMTAGLGIILYKIVVSVRGQKVTTFMRQQHAGLDTALLWLVIGFMILVTFTFFTE